MDGTHVNRGDLPALARGDAKTAAEAMQRATLHRVPWREAYTGGRMHRPTLHGVPLEAHALVPTRRSLRDNTQRRVRHVLTHLRAVAGEEGGRARRCVCLALPPVAGPRPIPAADDSLQRVALLCAPADAAPPATGVTTWTSRAC